MGRGQGKHRDFYTPASSCSDLFTGCLPLPTSPFLSKMHPKKWKPAKIKHKIRTVSSCFTLLCSESQIYAFAEWSWGLTPTTPSAQLLHLSVSATCHKGPSGVPASCQVCRCCMNPCGDLLLQKKGFWPITSMTNVPWLQHLHINKTSQVCQHPATGPSIPCHHLYYCAFSLQHFSAKQISRFPSNLFP